MKRIISLILILILSLSVLAACNGGDTTTTTTNAPASSYKPEAVRDYVRGLYIDLLDNNKTVKDFTLIAALAMYGAKYTVEWTVDNDAIAVVPSADGLEVTIDVPESVEADINYTLTGTVVAPDGAKASTSFDLVVPAPVVVGGMAELDMMGSTNLVEKTTDTVVVTIACLAGDAWEQGENGEMIAPTPDKYIRITLRENNENLFISAIQNTTAPEVATK